MTLSDTKAQDERALSETEQQDANEAEQALTKLLKHPPCLERTVIALYYTSVLLRLERETITIGDKTMELRAYMIDELTATLQLSNDEQNELLDSKRFIDQKNFKDAVSTLWDLLKRVRPFDVQEMLTLLELSVASAEQLRDKDIVLLLGMTGSGKSSLLHKVAGSTFEKVQGSNHIKPTNITNPLLTSVATSNSLRSVTRFLTAIPIKRHNKTYYFVDPPGFGDTAGNELDVANIVGIIHAIKICKSVRPVLLVANQQLSRITTTSLLSMLTTISNMIPRIAEHLNSFTYVFTHFTEETKQTLPATLRCVSETIDTDCEAVREIIDSMVVSTRIGALVVDLINDEPETIVSILTSRAPIQYPNEVFERAISNTAQTAINEQIRKNQLQIMAYIESGRFDYIHYKLKEMKQLHKLLEQDFIAKIIDECAKQVKIKVIEAYSSASKSIRDTVDRNNTLVAEDMVKFKQVVDYIRNAEQVREHLDETVTADSLLQVVVEIGTTLATFVETSDLKDSLMKVKLDNLLLISQYFELMDGYKRAQSSIAEKLELVEYRASENVTKYMFDEYAKDMSFIKSGLTNLEGHIRTETLNESLDKLRTTFASSLDGILRKLTYLVESPGDNADELVELDNIMMSMQKSIHLLNHFDSSTIEEYVNNFSEITTKAFNNFKVQIESALANVNTEFASAFEVSKRLVHHAQVLSNLKTIDSFVSKQYFALIEQHCNGLAFARRSIGPVLSQLRSAPALTDEEDYVTKRVDYIDIAQQVLTLRNAEWLKEFRQGVYESNLQDVESQLVDHFKDLHSDLLVMSLDLEDPDRIRRASRALEQFNNRHISAMLNILPRAKEECEKMIATYQTKVNSSLTLVQHMCEVKEGAETTRFDFQISAAQKVHKLLVYCMDSQLNRENANKVRVVFERYLRLFAAAIDNEVASASDAISQSNVADKTIMAQAQKLAKHLKLLRDLSNPNYALKSFFSVTREQIIERFELQWYELQSHMDDQYHSGMQHELKKLIKIARWIGYAVDDHISFKYDKLVEQYRDNLTKQAALVNSDLVESIKSHKYLQVANRLSVLKRDTESTNDYENMKQMLQTSLLGYIVNVTADAASLHSSEKLQTDVRPIIECLNNLSSAEQNVAGFLDGLAREELVHVVERVKSIIDSIIVASLDEIDKKMENTEFQEANQRAGELKVVLQLLGTYCVVTTADRINGLHQKLDIEFRSIIVRYSNMPVSAYKQNPPREVIEKLNCMSRRSESEKIEEAIRQRFRSEIEKAKCSDNSERSLRQLEFYLSTLPEHVSETLQMGIDTTREELKNIQDMHYNDIGAALSENNLDFAKKLIDPKIRGSALTRNLLLSKLQEKKFAFDVSFDKLTKDWNTTEGTPTKEVQTRAEVALMDLLHLHNFQEAFDWLSDARSVYKIAEKQFTEFMDAVYRRLLQLKEVADSLTLPDDTLVQFERSMEFMDSLVAISQDRNYIGQLLLTAQDIEKIEIMYAELAKLFVQFQVQCQLAIEQHKVMDIKYTVNRLKKWEVLRLRVEKKIELYKIPREEPFRTVGELTALLSNTYRQICNDLRNVDLMNEFTKHGESKCNAFFETLNANIKHVRSAKEIHELMDSDIDASSLDILCVESLRNQVNSLYEDVVKRLCSASLEQEDFDIINQVNNILQAFEKYISKFYNVLSHSNDLHTKLMDTVTEHVVTIQNNVSDAKIVAPALIKLQAIFENLVVLKEQVSSRINNVLQYYQRANDNPNALAVLHQLLNQDKRYGQAIVAERACFKGASISDHRSKTMKQDIHYVIGKDGNTQQYRLSGKGVNICYQKVSSRYRTFDEEVKKNLDKYLAPDTPRLPELINSIKYETNKVVQYKNGSVVWNSALKNFIPKLLAGIFSVWTLKNSQYYFDALDTKENYLLTAHAVQVVSIFRLFSVVDKDDEQSRSVWSMLFGGSNHNANNNRLLNNLVQIGTGEGKSVILAATSIILALVGYDVSCACYSEYLSKRDYDEFVSLFEAFNVSGHIHYGTFSNLCEAVINENGNVRELVRKFILGDRASIKPRTNTRKKVLLIDEVDVFFSQSFYGKRYNPATVLKDPTITALINRIWDERSLSGDKYKRLNDIKQTQEYKDCCSKLGEWSFLVEESVHDMLTDLDSFENHGYTIQEGKIAYAEQDGYTVKTAIGFKTLFAYYYETELGRITRSTLEENIGILVSCGNLSYAEIPKEFEYIMGVTGTLDTLSQPELDIIENSYAIRKHTYTPSVFGDNNRVFYPDRDIKIENIDNYYNRIVEQITNGLQSTVTGSKRAVLLFFETQEKLFDFYQSSSFALYKDKCKYITEELSWAEKDSLVKRATTAGQVTLLTRIFGRGTDFVCRDPNVSSGGGAHVIQTFLSEELSEQVQIMGRTARQGQQGSYEMILLENDLEKFGVTAQDLQQMRDSGKFKTILYQRRTEFFERKYNEEKKDIEGLQREHNMTRDFIRAILEQNDTLVKQFLMERNKGSSLEKASRTLVLIDRTGSMSQMLSSTKSTVNTMHERAKQIIADQGVTRPFEMQIALYTNYNCKEDLLLQHSSWESKPENLRAFMENVNVAGGMGNEAIEIGFAHANLENAAGFVSQIILIGDMPANTKQDVTAKRKRFGEDYWKDTKYRNATFAETELEKLKQANIPIHAFYVDRCARESFEHFAKETNGRCAMLDINSATGAEQLTNLVTEEVLRSVGGDECAEAYRKTFVCE
jgi:GTPase SAR1 family protein